MSAEPRIRTLVVDDSAFARKVVREILSREPDVDVVDIARDGLEAMEKIDALKPDVVTLDLMMPGLDGLGVLKALEGNAHAPKVVVVSVSGPESELGIEALSRGAMEVVAKPTALATDRMYEMAKDLVFKVRAAAQAIPRAFAQPQSEPVGEMPASVNARMVVVGTSTGGPQALTRLITALPGNFPVPIAIALHIPAGFTAPLAARIDHSSALRVVEAYDGLRLDAGVVALAPGGLHLKIERREGALWAKTDVVPMTTAHRPSVDVLFESAALAADGPVVGVMLTGMGDDGLAGSHQIHRRGGLILAEARESCVVYGMPRVVQDAGIAHAEVHLDRMPQAVLDALARL